MKLRLIFLSLLALSFGSHGECINNHDNVTIIGRLTVEAFPGPPDFESIKQGDKTINELIIHVDKLSRLKCIIDTDDSDEKIDSQSNGDDWSEYMEIIAHNSDDYLLYKEMVGKRVSISGKVILATSPYHYTQALIYDISEMKEASKK